MSPGPGTLIFATIPVAVLAAIHYYLYARLIRDLGLSRGWHAGVSIALVSLAICIPVAMVLARTMPSPWRTLLAWPGSRGWGRCSCCSSW